MNLTLCLLVSVATISSFAALVSGEKCYNEAKAKVLTEWLKGKMNKLCTGGYKPGTSANQFKYSLGLVDKMTAKSFLGCDKPIPGLSAIIESAKGCHNKLTKKDYCQKEVKDNFKDCLMGEIMIHAPGVMTWWGDCCKKISDHLIVPTAKSKAKIGPWIDKFPKN